MAQPDTEHTVYIRYKNHREVTAWRRIVPVDIWFGVTEWHSARQWFLRARDLDKQPYRDDQGARDFALADILDWRTTSPEPEPEQTRPKIVVFDRSDSPAPATMEVVEIPYKGDGI